MNKLDRFNKIQIKEIMFIEIKTINIRKNNMNLIIEIRDKNAQMITDELFIDNIINF